MTTLPLPFNISFIILCCSALYLEGHAQDAAEERLLQGRLLDAATHDAVPYASIVKDDRHGVISDAEGFFSIWVSAAEVLAISHVSYEPLLIKADTLVSIAGVCQLWLLPHSTVLDELMIRDVVDENTFKQTVLQTEVIMAAAEENVRYNSTLIQYQYQMGYRVSDDGQQNFHYYIAGPQNATILSTNLRSGLPGAVRKLFKTSALPATPRHKRD